MVLDDFHCSNDDGSPVMLFPDDHGAGTCAGKNQQWVVQPNGTITNNNNGKCLDVWDFAGECEARGHTDGDEVLFFNVPTPRLQRCRSGTTIQVPRWMCMLATVVQTSTSSSSVGVG